MNNGTANQVLRHRKAELKAKIRETRGLIRQDINDLKEDLNPIRAAGHMIKNMLQPSPDGQMTNSGVLNFGIDTGISMLINRFIPGRSAAKVIAPVLLKNLATHVVPQAKERAEKFLRWVADKTDNIPDPEAPRPARKRRDSNKNLAKKTATRFLRWVAEKTEKKDNVAEPITSAPTNGKVESFYGPVSG